MENSILVVNLGSASKKYALFVDGARRATGHFEKIPSYDDCSFGLPDGFALTLEHLGEKLSHEKSIIATDYEEAGNTFRRELEKVGISLDTLTAIGVRVVAPGTYFQEHHPVSPAYEERLQRIAAEAPLHINPLIAELGRLQRAFPRIPIMGISDSAFHRTMPRVARLYGLPRELVEVNDLHRFGYHGLSVASVAHALQERNKLAPRVIVMHLGSGASVTALANGKSIETSMGFTPLEGLLMSTRSGTLDPGLVIALTKKLGVHALEELLETKSGLLGVSGKSADVRELLKREGDGDTMATEALDLFAYQVAKHVGIATVALGGVDTLVFTGTIGERSAPMRKRIVERLGFLSASLDLKKNEELAGEGEIHISKTLPLLIVPAHEDEEIARETAILVSQH